MNKTIYISYRRTDSEGFAERIFDYLQSAFGSGSVYMDFTDIGVNENFNDAIKRAISSCQVVIVLIGPNWLSVTDEMGRKRLDDPHDFVRVEIQAALDCKVHTVPVLVNGAKLPEAEDLPHDLQNLIRYKAVEIRPRHYDKDILGLVTAIEKYVGQRYDPKTDRSKDLSTRKFQYLRWLISSIMIIGIVIVAIFYVSESLRSSEPNEVVDQTVRNNVVDSAQGLTETPTLNLPVFSVTEYPATTPTNSITISATKASIRTLTPVITGSTLPAEMVDQFGIDIVQIPEGSFMMGTDGQEPWDVLSRPAHIVSLDVFYIDKFEVTNSQYENCVSAGKCQKPLLNRSKTNLSYYDNVQYANYPVIYVSWFDAQSYCAWRGGRLPREAEWEKAARGDRLFIFPWGGEFANCQYANFWPEEACQGDTLPADSLSAGLSPYGIYNMSGNVQEWVSDWFQPYPGGDPNATKEFGAARRAIRGGAYNDGLNNIRTISRKGLDPNSAQAYVGFRCVIDIEALP